MASSYKGRGSMASQIDGGVGVAGGEKGCRVGVFIVGIFAHTGLGIAGVHVFL